MLHAYLFDLPLPAEAVLLALKGGAYDPQPTPFEASRGEHLPLPSSSDVRMNQRLVARVVLCCAVCLAAFATRAAGQVASVWHRRWALESAETA